MLQWTSLYIMKFCHLLYCSCLLFLIGFLFWVFPVFNINNHVICKTCTISSFPIWMHFVSLACLIALARTLCWRTMSKNGGERGQPGVVPDFRGKAFSFSALHVISAKGLLYVTCIMLRYFYTHFMKFLKS